MVKCGDCLELLKELPTGSVDCCITDPPYFKVKSAQWDNQWKNKQSYLDWLSLVLTEIKRVLKPNGSIILFIGDKMLFEVGELVSQHFVILNNLIWVKPDAAGAEKGAKAKAIHSFITKVEYAIFAEVPNTLGQQIKNHRQEAGISAASLSAMVNNSGRPTGLVGLWEDPYSKGGCLPSSEQYTKAISYCKPDMPLQQIQSDYYQRKRVFNVPDKDYYDVFSSDYLRGKNKIHSCQKPYSLIAHYIASISQPGFIVLDPFMGSGVVGKACKNLGRQFIGFEKDADIFKLAVNNIEE